MKTKYIILIAVSALLIGIMLAKYAVKTTCQVTNIQVRSTPLR